MNPSPPPSSSPEPGPNREDCSSQESRGQDFRGQDFRDQVATIGQLRELVREFVDARDWRQFHTPKNLSMALSIEAAELMEHFQWLTPEASREVAGDEEKRQAVGEEMADVLCYLLAIANELDLDMADAMQAKMKKNALKYPVSEYRGRYGADDPNPTSE